MLWLLAGLRLDVEHTEELASAAEAVTTDMGHCWMEMVHANQLYMRPPAGLYAPQDAEELASAAEAVATGVELLLDELPAAGPAQKQVAAAMRRAAEAHDALLGAVSTLAQEAREHDSQRPDE